MGTIYSCRTIYTSQRPGLPSLLAPEKALHSHRQEEHLLWLCHLAAEQQGRAWNELPDSMLEVGKTIRKNLACWHLQVKLTPPPGCKHVSLQAVFAELPLPELLACRLVCRAWSAPVACAVRHVDVPLKHDHHHGVQQRRPVVQGPASISGAEPRVAGAVRGLSSTFPCTDSIRLQAAWGSPHFSMRVGAHCSAALCAMPCRARPAFACSS